MCQNSAQDRFTFNSLTNFSVPLVSNVGPKLWANFVDGPTRGPGPNWIPSGFPEIVHYFSILEVETSAWSPCRWLGYWVTRCSSHVLPCPAISWIIWIHFPPFFPSHLWPNIELGLIHWAGGCARCRNALPRSRRWFGIQETRFKKDVAAVTASGLWIKMPGPHPLSSLNYLDLFGFRSYLVFI